MSRQRGECPSAFASVTGVSEYARFTAFPSGRTSPVSRITYLPRMLVHGAPSVRTTSSAPRRRADDLVARRFGGWSAGWP